MEHGEDQNRLVTNQKKGTVGKMAQPDAADVRKADGKVKRVFGGGKHGITRLVNEPDSHGGFALVIPEGRILHVTVNERML